MHDLKHLWPRSAVATLLAACAFFIVAAFPPTKCLAQDPLELPPPSDTMYEFELSDGTVLFARIIQIDGDQVVLVTLGGTQIQVDRSDIAEFREAHGQVRRGRFWPEDPSGTRLFFTSTGRSLRQGTGYVGTYVVVLPFAAVGITNRITFAAGAPVLLGEFEPFYIAPKIQLVRHPRVQVALGALAFFYKKETVGVTYAVATIGQPDRAASLGFGVFFSGDDYTGNGTGMVGAEVRVSRRIKLITENYVIPSSQLVILSGGLRVMGDRFATEVGAGLFSQNNDGLQCCIPLLNFSYKLGK